MTERLADIGARIGGIRQLGAVVNAMRGMAAARAQQAQRQLSAVETFSAMLAAAIGRALAGVAVDELSGPGRHARLGLVLFCAEQGFAGAFSGRVLDAVGPDLRTARVFLIGARGTATAAERGVTPTWSGAMPSRSDGVPRLADRIAEALYARIANGDIDRLDAVFSQWQPGHAAHIERRCLFPLDKSRFQSHAEVNPPLLNLTPEALLRDLTADYVHAQLCEAALHAFAAENQARMESMASAHSEIERQLSRLQGQQRVVRQEEITAEIIELAAGEAASRMSGR